MGGLFPKYTEVKLMCYFWEVLEPETIRKTGKLADMQAGTCFRVMSCRLWF